MADRCRSTHRKCCLSLIAAVGLGFLAEMSSAQATLDDVVTAIDSWQMDWDSVFFDPVGMMFTMQTRVGHIDTATASAASSLSDLDANFLSFDSDFQAFVAAYNVQSGDQDNWNRIIDSDILSLQSPLTNISYLASDEHDSVNHAKRVFVVNQSSNVNANIINWPLTMPVQVQNGVWFVAPQPVTVSGQIHALVDNFPNPMHVLLDNPATNVDSTVVNSANLVQTPGLSQNYAPYVPTDTNDYSIIDLQNTQADGYNQSMFSSTAQHAIEMGQISENNSSAQSALYTFFSHFLDDFNGSLSGTPGPVNIGTLNLADFGGGSGSGVTNLVWDPTPTGSGGPSANAFYEHFRTICAWLWLVSGLLAQAAWFVRVAPGMQLGGGSDEED